MSETTTDTGGGFVEKLKGKAKQLAGSVIGDETLKHEGQLHEDKAEAAAQAAKLEREAEQRRQEAELKSAEKELSVERQQLAAEEANERRQEQLERERAEAEQRIEREHAAREAAVEKQEQARQAAISRDEVRAVQEKVAANQQAAVIEAEADRARATAEALDRAADQS